MLIIFCTIVFMSVRPSYSVSKIYNKHLTLYQFKHNILRTYNVLCVCMLGFLSATFYLSAKFRWIFIYVCVVYHYIIKYILINSIQNCVFLFSDLECVTFYYIFVYT